MDLAEIVHQVHRNLVRQHDGRTRGPSKLMMKMDIEGSEFEVVRSPRDACIARRTTRKMPYDH